MTNTPPSEIHNKRPILLTRKEAAALLNVNSRMLDIWAWNGKMNLPYVKFGKTVRYREEDVLKFIEENLVNMV